MTYVDFLFQIGLCMFGCAAIGAWLTVVTWSTYQESRTPPEEQYALTAVFGAVQLVLYSGGIVVYFVARILEHLN